MARQFGLDVKDTAAILAIFSNNGIGGAEAGTQLRSMLTHMISNAKPTVNDWNELGVSLYDANGNVRDLNIVMAELDAALDKLPMQEQNRLTHDLAGTYGQLGFTALRSGRRRVTTSIALAATSAAGGNHRHLVLKAQGLGDFTQSTMRDYLSARSDGNQNLTVRIGAGPDPADIYTYDASGTHTHIIPAYNPTVPALSIDFAR